MILAFTNLFASLVSRVVNQLSDWEATRTNWQLLKAMPEKNLCSQGTKIEQSRVLGCVDEIRCLLWEETTGRKKTLSDLHKHAQCFLVTIHVPSPLTFLLVLDVTMTSCKNSIVLVILNFKHMQMSSRFLYTNVSRLLFFNLDNLEMACRPFSCIRSSLLGISGRTKSATPTSSPGSSRFRLLLSCRHHIGKREDPGNEVDVTHGSQWRSIAKM